jgi:hypothetical protein
MRATRDVGAGDWIKPRLRGWGVVGGVVPRGYAAYVRILHPGSISQLVGHDSAGRPIVDERPARWREVAALCGTVLHPAAQWAALAGSADQIPLGADRYLDPPHEGQLPLSELAALARVLLDHDAVEVVLGVWRGWGELRPTGGSIAVYLPAGTSRKEEERAQAQAERERAARPFSDAQHLAETGPWLELPDREYVLLRGELREFAEPGWVRSAGLGWYPDDLTSTPLAPNLLWPTHLDWFVGTEIDFDSTLLGGNRALVEAVLNSPDLEALEVSEDTDLTHTGDQINHQPAN